MLFWAGRVYAEEITASSVSIDAGGTAALEIGLNNTGTNYAALQLNLYLPDGMGIAKDGGDYLITKSSRLTSNHQISAEYDNDTQSYTIIIMSLTNTVFSGTDGALFTVTLQANKSLDGNYEGSVKGIILTDRDNESVEPSDLNFSITVQGLPTVTADNKSRVYGDDNPEFTYKITGGTISETPTLTTTATETSVVGEYPITVSTSNNYNAVNGTLTVTQAPLTISGGTYTIKQGETLPTLAPVFSEFKNNETSEVLTSQPTLAYEAEVTSASAPGTYNIIVTGGEATNYEITRTNGTLTITAADPVTVTAKSYEITYGDALPDFSYTSEGADLVGEPSVSCAATADSGYGTYDIEVSQGSITNYNVTYVKGTLTIKKASLTIEAEDKSKTYGDANPEFTCTYNGFVKGESSSVLTTQPTLNTEATAASGVGTYDITVSGATADNYEITQNKGTLTVTKANLTATAKSYTRKQGEPNPTLEVEYSGWKNEDGVASLTTEPTASTTATPASEPNTYDITVSGGQAENYDFTYVKGTLTVSEADPVTVTAKSYTIKYGEAIPTFEYTTTGATLNGTPAISCEASVTSNVGTYPIVISKGSVTNYNDTYVNGVLTIEKAPLTATAKSYTVEQGVATPTLEIEYAGFKNSEMEEVLDMKPTATTERVVDSAPGEYAITVSGGEDNNYDITTENGTLTVTLPGLITVTVTDAERSYGSENPTFAYTVSGGTLTGEPEITCTADKTSAPGEYDITIAMGTISNYNVSLVGGKLTVKKAALTITADNKSKVYGEDNPTLTCTYSGFVNNETDAVVTTKPTLTTTAIATSNVGTYDITAADAVAANYDISYAKGTLTINPKPLTLSVSLGTTLYSYDGDEKEPSVTVTATDNTVITTSDYELSGTLSATIAGNYSITAIPKGNYTGSAVSAEWSIASSTSTDAEGNSITEDGVDVTLESASGNNIDENGILTLPDEITKIDDNAFSGIDKTKIESVDLTNTNLTGVNVDRESGAFSDFPENVMIYLPSGNTAAADEPNVVIAGECQELKLIEDGEVEIPTGFTAAKITYVRSLTVEKASTICLPYTLSSDATISYYELSSSTANALVFTEVTTTDANKPYLAIPKTAGASLGKTVSTSVSSNTNIDDAEQSVTGYNMIGTEKRISRADAMGKYILQDDNMWHQVTSESPASVYIPAYRAYIESTTSAPARLQIVVEGSDGTTAISRIKTIDADGSDYGK